MRLRWLALLALAPLTGCGLIYKVDAQQGNLFDKATVESLKPGMSKRQVLLVMGSPSVISPFDQNRWDYVSTIRRGRNKMASKDLTLYFENDQLAKDSAAGSSRVRWRRASQRRTGADARSWPSRAAGGWSP